MNQIEATASKCAKETLRHPGTLRVRGTFASRGCSFGSGRNGSAESVYDQSVRYPSMAPLRSGRIVIDGPDDVEFARTFGAGVRVDVPIEGVARTTLRSQGQTFVEDTASFPFFGPLNAEQDARRPDRFKLELDVVPEPTAPDTPEDKPLFDAMRAALEAADQAQVPLSQLMRAMTEVLPDGNVIVRANVNYSPGNGWHCRVSFVQWTTARGVGSQVPLPAWLRALLPTFCAAGQNMLSTLQGAETTLTAYDEITFADAYYDGTRWTTRPFAAAGTTSGQDVELVRNGNAQENAAALFHEAVHTQQSPSTSWSEREYAAYVAEEGFRIRAGMPPHHPSFRSQDGSIDTGAIREYVGGRYPGLRAEGEQVVGRTESGDTIVRRADGTRYTRPPQRGDSYPGPRTTRGDEVVEVVDLEVLSCP